MRVNRAWCPHHHDGADLSLGTLFARVKDFWAKGQSFTYHNGDIVTIATPKLGALTNRIADREACPEWTFGVRHLMANLARRQVG